MKLYIPNAIRDRILFAIGEDYEFILGQGFPPKDAYMYVIFRSVPILATDYQQTIQNENPGILVEQDKIESLFDGWARERFNAPEMKSSREYLTEIVGKPIELLGTGGMGEVWGLPDGTVIKITSSKAELECVTRLFEAETNNKPYSVHAPRIYGIGEILESEYVFFSEIDGAIPHTPVFWFLREPLEDILLEFGELAIERKEALKDIVRKHQLYPIDYQKSSNWGIRLDSGELVMRDLACVAENFFHPNQSGFRRNRPPQPLLDILSEFSDDI